MSTSEVVVLGGGAAGLQTALMLRSRDPDRTLTLVNADDDLVYRPSLITLPAGGDETQLRYSLPAIAARAEFTHVRATVTRIDLPGRQLELADGTVRPYGRLVVAAGAPTDRARVPGAAAHALFPCGTRDAVTFAERVRSVLHGTVTIVLTGERTGPGLEYAAHLARHLRTSGSALRLRVVDDRPYLMAPLGQRASRYLHDLLTSRGVEVQAGAAVTEIGDGEVVLSDGRRLSSDITAVIGPLRGPELGLPDEVCTPAGFLFTDSWLGLRGHPEVLVAGDAAHLTDAPDLPKSWMFARRQAATAAAILTAQHHDQPVTPFDLTRAQRLASLSLPDVGGTALLVRSGRLLATGRLPYLLRRRLDRANLRVLRAGALDSTTGRPTGGPTVNRGM